MHELKNVENAITAAIDGMYDALDKGAPPTAVEAEAHQLADLLTYWAARLTRITHTGKEAA